MSGLSDARASATRPLRVLIVDDELHNRHHIAGLLGKFPVHIVGQASDGHRAVEAIKTLQPELVFLDVQMPEMTGLDVIAAIGMDKMPPTIFVTAHEQYAVAGFEVAAIDYLVKPFDDARFARALQRAMDHVALRREQASRAEESQEELRREMQRPYPDRIPVSVGGNVFAIRIAEIDYIKADGPYVDLHVGGRFHTIRESLQSLERRLDPERFGRIHRSVLVQFDRVTSLRRLAGGDAEIKIRGGLRLRVSRTHRVAVETMLGLLK